MYGKGDWGRPCCLCTFLRHCVGDHLIGTVPSPHRKRARGELYGALWCLGFALVWLLPTRTLPWTTFYAEAFCAFLLLIAGAWALSLGPGLTGAGHSSGVDWQPPVTALLVIAGVASWQALSGQLVLAAEVYWLLLALAGMALTWLMAAHAQTRAPGRLVDHLWTGLLIAASVSVAIALMQWTGLTEEWQMLVRGTGPGGRVEAHVGQSNNLATLLCWALIAVWWHYERGRISAATALTLAAYLVIGIALTRSRTAWISLGLIALVAMMVRNHCQRRIAWYVAPLLGLWLVFLWFGTPTLWQTLSGTGAVTDARPTLSVGPREQIYRMALAAIWERPWLGWGWGQVAVAQVAMAPQFPTYGGFASYAHNILLDLSLWFGLPVALGVFSYVCWWLYGAMKREWRPESWMVFAGVGVFGTHAMLELPHGYAYMYLPTAVMAGTLSGMKSMPAKVQVPVFIPWVIWCALAIFLAILVRDYREIEGENLSWRLYEARIGRGIPPPAPDVWILDAIPQANQELRRRATPNMSPDTRKRWYEVVSRYPALGALARHAQGAALNHDPAGVRWSLSTICLLFEPRVCRQVLVEFREFEKANGLPASELDGLPRMSEGPG